MYNNIKRHIMYNNIKISYFFFPSLANEWLKLHVVTEHLTVRNNIRQYKPASTKWTYSRVILHVHQSNAGRVQPCLRNETLGLDSEILRLRVLGSLTALVRQVKRHWPLPAHWVNQNTKHCQLFFCLCLHPNCSTYKTCIVTFIEWCWCVALD